MSLCSMTGYGRASCRRGALSAEAEARSVNGRFLQVRCRVPAELLRLEPRLEALVREAVERGTVDVFVKLRADRAAATPRINRKALAVYRRELLSLGGGETSALLALPGVVSFSEEQLSVSAQERLALEAVGAALAQMCRARDAEGGRLRRALARELAALRRHAAAVRRLSPAAVKTWHATLRARCEALLAGASLRADDPSLLREVALLASRTDVTEELDRLDSHLDALTQSLDSREAVGRSLEFLLQELGREVNTIGSKCADAGIAARVLRMKSSVERLREQAANIE